MSEAEGTGELAVRLAGAFLPTVVTANLLGVWLPKPLAWAISIAAWNVAIYLIPPRPTMSFKRWLMIVLVLVIAGMVIAIVQPTML